MWKAVVIGFGLVLLTGGLLRAGEREELEMRIMLLQEMAKSRMSELRVIQEIELPKLMKQMEEMNKPKKEEKK